MSKVYYLGELISLKDIFLQKFLYSSNSLTYLSKYFSKFKESTITLIKCILYFVAYMAKQYHMDKSFPFHFPNPCRNNWHNIVCWRFLLNIMKWLAPLEDDLSPLEYYFSRVAKMLPIIHTMLNPIIYRYQGSHHPTLLIWRIIASLMTASLRRRLRWCCNQT